MNKIERLKEEVPIISVLNYLGYPYEKKGINYFCRCPKPDHADVHPNNCHFKEGWKKLYCEVCAESISSIDLIMYVENKDFHDAVEELWVICGSPKWFKETDNSDTFYLNKRQKELLNWYPNPKAIIVNGVSEFKPSGPHIHDGEIYLSIKSVHNSANDFASKEEQNIILYNKCTERINELKNSKKIFKNDKEILGILENDLKEIYTLRSKVKSILKKESA